MRDSSKSRNPKKQSQKKAQPPSTLKVPGPEAEDSFPIAGVGSSAGGVEAFTKLLERLPPDIGMGFVLVQHLDAKHASVLVEVLRRATQMPVEWASQNVAVERNHIYVLPPNADVEILNGKLQVKPRTTARVSHLPVDRFLESLARDRGSVAIGVILSGTASDGTLGLKAIKAEGGITFAQSEASAKYSGMPSSAISAGVVDYVLPPEGIARELARIGRHPYVRLRESALAPLARDSDHELATLFMMLRSANGVDFTHYKHTAIRRRIVRRMMVQKIDKLNDYLQFIRKNPAELQQLYHDILINVTGFFRDPQMFRALKRNVFPRLLRKRTADDAIRVWVPGCSTGEEAYSIAIALNEYMRDKSENTRIQIFATDISDPAIEKARAGVYPENIAADVGPELLRRYFQPVNAHYQVIRGLRETCVFARQNVIQDAPFSKLDVISCRNLMIYLGPVLQRRVVNVFHYALKPAGFLVLGTSETIGTLSELFAVVDKKNKVYLKKPGTARRILDFQVSGPPQQPPEIVRTVPEDRHGIDPGREADRILVNRYSPPGVVINDQMKVLQFRGRTGRFLEPEPGEPNLNLLRMAREGMLPALRSVILQAKKKNEVARVNDVRVRYDGDFLNTSIEVVPFDVVSNKQPCYLVLFEEKPPAISSRESTRSTPKTEKRELQQLKQELTATKQYLQSIIEEQEANNEELKSANEEIQSSNEELQSINEEMETAKEELQSTNEELTIVNEELHTRNVELAYVNNDLNNLISSVQIPLVMVDSDGRLRRFTPPAEKLLNLIPTDVGRPLFDIKPNVELPDLREILRDVIDNLRVFEREVQDHHGHFYSMFVRPYRTEEKKIDGAVLAFVDVTALRHSMEQSRDLREYAEALAATVHEPLVAIDPDLRVITANGPFYRLFHLSPEQVIDTPLLQVAGGILDIPPFRTLLANRAGEGFTQGTQLEYTFGAAGPKTLSINVRRLPGTGPPRLILLAMEDTSERRRAEVALHESQVRYSAITREARVGTIQINPKGECSSANTLAARLVGVASDKMHGRGWMQNVYPEDLRMLEAKLEEASRGDEGFSMEMRFLYPGGATAWAYLILIPLREVGRQPAEYLIALTDLTPRKDLEERLAQAQKMEAIGRLAGGVAHDFNNLLTAISAYATQLIETMPKESAARAAALQINKLADHSALITRQLLAFSRKQVMHPRRLEINEVLRDMYDLLTRMLGEGVETRMTLHADAGSVVVDLGQIQQVILNLAINARDAMPDGGRLTISTERVSIGGSSDNGAALTRGDYVRISVSDTGIGMDAETLQHLFEPFFTTKPPGEGTGLGLSTAYGVIRQSAGTIHVESAPNKGTTFYLYLPRAGGEVEAPRLEPLSAVASGSETILVVEDSAVLRSLIREMLGERGYKVLEARDANEALKVAADDGDVPIHLMLTDVVMPGISGADLAKRLRRRRKHLKVIYMSGYSGESLQAVEKEVNFLEKPFKPGVLADLIRKVLDN